MTKNIFKNQGYHLLCYILIGTLLYVVTKRTPDSTQLIWGLSLHNWILFSWIFAGIFQMWIAVFWRLELYKHKISKTFGKAGFTIFKCGFVSFGAARLLPIIPISYLSAQTIIIPNYIRLPLIVGTTPFILWALYSVFFYFGINRAYGADHFFPEYRKGTLEIRGIFKYLPNSMYTVVLLLLYHPGLFWQSHLGLITALSHHAFIWVHYFCTEKPDIKEIYG